MLVGSHVRMSSYSLHLLTSCVNESWSRILSLILLVEFVPKLWLLYLKTCSTTWMTLKTLQLLTGLKSLDSGLQSSMLWTQLQFGGTAVIGWLNWRMARLSSSYNKRELMKFFKAIVSCRCQILKLGTSFGLICVKYVLVPDRGMLLEANYLRKGTYILCYWAWSDVFKCLIEELCCDCWSSSDHAAPAHRMRTSFFEAGSAFSWRRLSWARFSGRSGDFEGYN